MIARTFVLLVSAWPIAGCSPFADVEASVRQQMKDPDATQFRQISYCGKDGQSVITGEYNGKNSYGAYQGFETFYYENGISELAGTGGPLFEKCLAEMGAETEAIKARTKAMKLN